MENKKIEAINHNKKVEKVAGACKAQGIPLHDLKHKLIAANILGEPAPVHLKFVISDNAMPKKLEIDGKTVADVAIELAKDGKTETSEYVVKVKKSIAPAHVSIREFYEALDDSDKLDIVKGKLEALSKYYESMHGTPAEYKRMVIRAVNAYEHHSDEITNGH